MNDFAVQRTNMVESQLRPSDITDRRILRAMAAVRREVFVPFQLRQIAYMDEAIRLPAAGRSAQRAMLAPRTLAQLIQLMRVEPTHRILEVGCATGYATAVLARLAHDVVGLESNAELAAVATSTLASEGVGNARVVVGDLADGHAAAAPYDSVLVGGAIGAPSSALLDQLRDGGVLVGIVADGEVGRATTWRRHDMQYDRRTTFDATAPPLPGFAPAVAFSL
jgi:protein-L-isoaspartate(D-aspartate) O-methyltransferase